MTHGKTKKKQVCIRIDEPIVKDMERIRDKTGIPISKQVELKMKGYRICKGEEE